MIPSLLQIPSAVSDSKLHSVLPNNGKGDFQFERSTGATRINKDGLIEEVGYFSSELVQNGDFSELGSELVTNGDFATNSDWTLTGATINAGKVNVNSSSPIYIIQNSVATIGKTYRVELTVSDYVSGDLRLRYPFTKSESEFTGNGTYVFYGVAVDARVELQGRFSGQTYDYKIDNVSVKQVDPNNRWSLGTGWSYGENKISKSTGSNRFFPTINSWTSGAKFLFKLTVSNRTTGYLRIQNVGSTVYYANNIDDNGDLRFIFDSIDANGWEIEAVSSFDGDVTNISVVEVQGDRPRLSYDITNGVVEGKPHLLLEPSSTNLITFSEDLNQFPTKSQISVSSNVAISPDGTQNADKLIPNTSNVSTHYIRQDISVSNGVGYVISFFAKKGEYNYVNTYTSAYSTGVSATWDLNAGVVILGGTNADIQDFGNGWYRCIWKGTTNSTSLSYRIYVSELENRNAAFAGDGIKGIYVWGATLEQQAFATSYIKTAGTTITRAAETCNNSKPSVNSTEGVLYAEIAALADDGTFRMLSVSDGTTNNRVRINYSATSQQLQARLVTGGVTQADLVKYSTGVTSFQKAAIQYKANEVKLYVNGSLASSDTSASVPSAGTLNVINFNGGDGTFPFYGKVKGLAVYNEALSESQLFQLTGVTASSIYNNFVTRTASFTVEALNEVKKVIDNL